MRPAISISSSLGVKSTSRLTKLKRTPRTPAACMDCSSWSLMLRLTVAMPRALPSARFSTSIIALLSAPWQVACTTTFLLKPRWSRNANSWSALASQGVYLRSGAYGNCAPGPNTWQCASTALGGSLNWGLVGPLYQSSQPGVFSNPPEVGLLMASSIDVAQPRLFQRFAHLVHVQAQHAGRELGALLALVRFARGSRVQDLLRIGGRNDDDTVVVRHHHVA